MRASRIATCSCSRGRQARGQSCATCSISRREPAWEGSGLAACRASPRVSLMVAETLRNTDSSSARHTHRHNVLALRGGRAAPVRLQRLVGRLAQHHQSVLHRTIGRKATIRIAAEAKKSRNPRRDVFRRRTTNVATTSSGKRRNPRYATPASPNDQGTTQKRAVDTGREARAQRTAPSEPRMPTKSTMTSPGLPQS